MEPLKVELDALREVMFTPVEQFVSDKDAETRTPEALEALAHKRMFSTAIKAVDAARGARTLYMVVLRFGHGSSTFYSGYGPYATKPQAEKAVEKLGKALGYSAFAIVPMRNAEGLEQLLKDLDANPESKGEFGVVSEDARLFRAGWNGKQATRKKYEAAR